MPAICGARRERTQGFPRRSWRCEGSVHLERIKSGSRQPSLLTLCRLLAAVDPSTDPASSPPRYRPPDRACRQLPAVVVRHPSSQGDAGTAAIGPTVCWPQHVVAGKFSPLPEKRIAGFLGGRFRRRSPLVSSYGDIPLRLVR